MIALKNFSISGAEGRSMTADLFIPEGQGRFPLVIYAHGFAGFKDWGNNDLIASHFPAKDLAYLRFNFSHNGTTPDQPCDFADLEAFGKNTCSCQLYDLQCILDWVEKSSDYYVKQHLDTQQIFLIGHSLGGGLALVTAANDSRIKRLVTWAGVSSLRTPWKNWPEDRIAKWKLTGVDWYENKRTGQQMPLNFSLYADFQEHQKAFDLTAAAMRLNIPWLIVHGSNDQSVDQEHARWMHQWQPSSTLLITEGDHVFDRKHPWKETALPAACQYVVSQTLKFLL